MEEFRNKLQKNIKIYWLLVIVIYLGISFITDGWNRTWIIWAVSGVLYALIRVIAESFIKEG